jgi:flavodoxin
MKTLIVYYSRTGTTKKVAEALAVKLGADLEALVDKTDRRGAAGYMLAGRDVLFKHPTVIEPVKYDPAQYELLVVLTPVWVGTMAVAVRQYLTEQADKLPAAVAFGATQAGKSRQRVFDDLAKLTCKPAKAELMLTTKEVVQGAFEEKLGEFIKMLG